MRYPVESNPTAFSGGPHYRPKYRSKGTAHFSGDFQSQPDSTGFQPVVFKKVAQGSTTTSRQWVLCNTLFYIPLSKIIKWTG
jgi:hypothetical protein